MTCFRTAHDMTRSSRAKRGARAEEEGLALRGEGGIEKAPWTAEEDAMYAVCGFIS